MRDKMDAGKLDEHKKYKLPEVVEDQDQHEVLKALTFTSFLSQVSVNGLKYVVESGNIVRKTIWLALVLFGMGFMFYQVSDRIQYFLSRPTSVEITVSENNRLAFPAITICNENTGSKARVAAGGERYATSLDALWSAVTRSAIPGAIPDWGLIQNLTDEFKDDPNFWRDIHMRVRSVDSNLTLSAESYIFFCGFSGTLCEQRSWGYVYTDMGVCLQFNADPSFNTVYSNRPGEELGLRLVLAVNQEDYFAPISEGAGIRIMFHNRGEHPDISDLGFRVSAGRINTISLKRKTLKNLPSPFSECRDSENYFQSNCLLLCQAEYVFKHCACQLFYHQLADVPTCNPAQALSCGFPSRNEFLNQNNLVDVCHCPSKCEIVEYVHELSSQVRSEFYKDAMVDSISILYNCGDNTTNATDISIDPSVKAWICTRENMLQYYDTSMSTVIMYYSSLRSEDIVTTPAYTWLALLCDIGGALGLMLGSTLLTIFEFGDFFVRLCVTLVEGRIHKNKHIRPMT